MTTKWTTLSVPGGTTGVRVLAIDPGAKTGFAMRRTAGEVLVATAAERDLVFAALDCVPADVLVFEEYQVYGMRNVAARAGLIAIGDVRTALRVTQHGELDIVAHKPQRRLAFMAQAVVAGATGHEADALAHLLAYEEASRCG